MIITKILDHDLHRSRSATATPHAVHTPARPEFLPAVVSSSRGKFMVTKILFGNGEDRYCRPSSGPAVMKRDGRVISVDPDVSKTHLYLASGVFDHDSDRVDSVLGDLFSVALDLCVSDELGNVFDGESGLSKSFSYVQKSSGMKIQPHVCLVPAWDPSRIASVFGSDYEPSSRRFRRHCRVISCDVAVPVFLSRPDLVGLYTQFMGGGASIVLHNVQHGMAFFRPENPGSA